MKPNSQSYNYVPKRLEWIILIDRSEYVPNTRNTYNTT